MRLTEQLRHLDCRGQRRIFYQADKAVRQRRQRHPLTGQWILVSPHRAKRPWQGAQETPAKQGLPAHVPDCFLCPGNV
ncbi:hypothetical protein, partial [Pseudomonas aeruginosa]|uniref:hypothetical protein n=1 Tax=Pseudomonas aeruginosa TaxID=287 RepID=UPI003D18E730